MDRRSLELLELPAVLERLAAAAASEPGQALCLALEPSADADEVEQRQTLTTEAIAPTIWPGSAISAYGSHAY